MWKLIPEKSIDESGTSNFDNKAGLPVWEFKIKNNTFNCVSIFRPEPKEGEECEPTVYATVNTDKSIREIKTQQIKNGDQVQIKAKETQRFEGGPTYG